MVTAFNQGPHLWNTNSVVYIKQEIIKINNVLEFVSNGQLLQVSSRYVYKLHIVFVLFRYLNVWIVATVNIALE